MADLEAGTALENLHSRGAGTCLACGFLAKSAQPPAPLGFHEANIFERASGKLYEHSTIFQGQFRTLPECFRQHASLPHEVKAIAPENKNDREMEQATTNVIAKDRKCPKWFPYTPGLSPEQHLSRLDAQEQEQRQHWFQETMEEQRRNWERQLEDERRAWERKLEGERRRFDLILFAVVAILAVAEVTATILGVIFG